MSGPDMPDYAFDFLISRRGTMSAVAAEVATVLEGEGYRVTVQDYDFRHGGDFVADIHDALVAARNLFILHTLDYDQNIWTRKEFTNFLALVAASDGERRVCVLRCDDGVPRGILANTVYGDLVGVTDPNERRRIIAAVAAGQAIRQRQEPKIFGGAIPQRNLNFTGRASILARIEKLLAGAQNTQTIALAICGLGGMGKTSIVRACVDVLAPNYAGVWWANGQDRDDLVTALAGLAVRLEPQLESETDVEKLIRLTLKRIERCERPFLLIYDNIDSPQLIDEFLPARGAHVLITSRWSDWGGRCQEVLVDSMPEDEALAFLQTRAGRQDEEEARQLVHALGGLPLALDHAGAYVRSTMSSFQAYRRRLDKLLDKVPKNAPYPASVAATFAMAMECAVRECAAAEKVLAHLAFFSGERIPLYLLPATLIDEDERADALAALTSVSLVRSDPISEDEPAITVHRLVQVAARTRVAGQGNAARAFAQSASALAAALPENPYDEPTTWPRCSELIAHALALRIHARTLELNDPVLWQICDRIGQFLHGRSMLASAEEVLRDTVAFAEATHGASSLQVAHALNDLASLLQSAARFGEAEPLLRKSLALQETKLGRDDTACALTASNLAWLLHNMQRSDEAQKLLREAIAAGERSVGRAHPDVAVRINNLALVLQSQGQMEEAEGLLREALAAGESTLGRHHPVVVARLNNLASLLQLRGQAGEAEQLFRETIERGIQTLGREHPDVAIRLNNLATLLRDSGRYDEAEPLCREALVIFAATLGQRHPITARAERNLALLLLAIGRLEEALETARHALAVHEEQLGLSHRWTIESATVCADALNGLERHDEAAVLCAKHGLQPSEAAA
jgi:tetratricopeptide (TPR) repeat protein